MAHRHQSRASRYRRILAACQPAVIAVGGPLSAVGCLTGPPDGIVVLGGVISPEVSVARNSIAIEKRPSASHSPPTCPALPEGSHCRQRRQRRADFRRSCRGAVRKKRAGGSRRVRRADRRRGTVAQYHRKCRIARRVADPKPGERWLLVTSAYHMPRAMAAFRLAGFPVEACPVDWRTRGQIDLGRPFGLLSDGLHRTDTAVHEWLGLFSLPADWQDDGVPTRSVIVAGRRAATRAIAGLHGSGLRAIIPTVSVICVLCRTTGSDGARRMAFAERIFLVDRDASRGRSSARRCRR